ncbi:hypothetical protein B0H11DRAFT_576429 [Mycena galericulata]|nr:hypothetical protein B0H11DRAFT_576429 [Mycena galericulata]
MCRVCQSTCGNSKAAQTGSAGASCAWEWETASSFADSGPRRRPGDEDWTDNQTVFLRGFKVAIRSSPLKKSAKALSIVDSKPSDILSKSGFFPFSQSPTSGTASFFRNSAASSGGGASDDEETIEYFPASVKAYHLASVVNEYLLNSSPTADVAVTHDNDWTSILNENDEQFPDDCELVRRISQKYTRITTSGGVWLHEGSQEISIPKPNTKLRRQPVLKSPPVPELGDTDFTDEDTDTEASKETGINGTNRPPGSCPRCRNLKVKCVFKTTADPCLRCLNGGHDCVPPGRKKRRTSLYVPCGSTLDETEGKSHRPSRLDKEFSSPKLKILVDGSKESTKRPPRMSQADPSSDSVRLSSSSPPNKDSWPMSQSLTTRDVLISVVEARIVETWKRWNTSRDGEYVWPLTLEAALLDGLERYQPDGSRETRMLGRFRRRNQFISDYIFEKTGERRTAKQIGSRLQQLRESCGSEKKLLSRVSSVVNPPPNEPEHGASSRDPVASPTRTPSHCHWCWYALVFACIFG